MKPLNIKVKTSNVYDDFGGLNYNPDKGNWIDLRADKCIHLNAGEFAIIPLGVAMKLPEGYEAHVVPRSSTFKHYGIIQTNHIGIIDNSYCGDDDIWGMPVYALRDTVIPRGDRICQFRIFQTMGEVTIEPVDTLGGENRGGFGSTGNI